MQNIDSTSLSLWQIEQQLQELLAFREVAETPEEQAAADAEIDKYLAKELRKVNGIAGAIQTFSDWERTAKEHADRYTQLARSYASRVERIKAATLRAMQEHGVTMVETPEHRLTVCGNGGVQPLDLPSWPKDASGSFKMLSISEVPDGVPVKVYYAPNTESIREALKRGESVPGAKLLPRGKHLRCI